MSETWGTVLPTVVGGRWNGFARRCAAPLALAVGLLLLLVPSALAQTPTADIHSNGPLSDVWVGNDLSCQVAHAGDASDEFYPPGSAGPADCGTFLAYQGTLFGPDFSNHAGGSAAINSSPGATSGYAAWTAVSQTPVTGLGTAASPFKVTTVGTATLAGVPALFTVTEVDSYVVGNDNYRTDITVTNNTGSAASAILYRAADCYLQGSDAGYGEVNPVNNAPACTQTPNDSPPGQIEEFSPLTGGISWTETYYPNIWSDVLAQTNLPDTCDCLTQEDNTEGINWDVSLAAGASATYSMLSNFSPTGQIVGHPAVATGTPAITSSSGGSLGGSVNPSGSQITSCYFQWGTTTNYGNTARCLQNPGAGNSPVAVSSAPLSGLTPGVTYHFRLVATNAQGTSISADATFTTPLPPTIGQNADVFPVSGVIYVELPHGYILHRGLVRKDSTITNGPGFVPLSQAAQLPVGTKVDSRGGTLNLTTATSKRHQTQTATLTGAIFNFSQSKRGKSKGLTTFSLTEKAFAGAPSYASCSISHSLVGASKLAAIARLSAKVLQTLKARDHHGKFRTRGRYSAATVRGTWWSVADRCNGTYTAVQKGTVVVSDFRTHKSITVHAGHHYLAKAP